MTRIALCFAFTLSACIADAGDDLQTDDVTQDSVVAPTITQLSNDQPAVVSGGAGSTRYFSIAVAAGFDMFGVGRWLPNPQLDVGANVYMKRGALPTTTSYDCRIVDGSSTGSCRFNLPAAATYYIMVRGTTGYQNLSVEATYWNEYTPITNNWSSRESQPNGIDVEYKLDVPAGASNLTFSIALDASDTYGVVDLIVRHGMWPTDTTYDCFDEAGYNGPYTHGAHTVTCTFAAPQVGTYYVQLHSHHRYYGTFTAHYAWMPINAM